MDGNAFIKYDTLDVQDANDDVANICLSLRKVAKDTEYRVAVSYLSDTLPSQRVKKCCTSVYIVMPETEQQETKAALEEMFSEELKLQGFHAASKLEISPGYYMLDKDTEWRILFSGADVGGHDERSRGYNIQSVAAVCRDIPFWLVREGKVQKDSRTAMIWLTHDTQGIDETKLARIWEPSEFWEAFPKGRSPLESIDPVISTPGDRENDSEYFDAEEEKDPEYFDAKEF
ncbi:hypothetical protein ASPVEDRAFT_37258 [Aspergillus versicolor CBS 583.65]|uniref:Uncharacterized protein n=1 Tax=Aspergillus versicolor CBS 583.65 TaxID=1036611 RepID=A0A1L9P8L0_ASPVE|nr:uncharacterized protein ASPVEDRAFT_37258 [Aspergillus versicolor CBS 583.65]OJI97822.1 hypothetical protein ASPVEDRAFT_37258 [Aspergillus versicolor CBS 583.65]